MQRHERAWRKLFSRPEVVLVVVLLLGAVGQSHAATLVGDVVGIADGDTLTILDSAHVQWKIRLAGIDAPEKTQPFGARSKQNLAALVWRKHVSVEWQKLDRYGRTIGKVIFNGHDVNLMQVSGGLAWHYKTYAAEQSPTDRVLYAEAEVKARQAGVGLWRDRAPVPPWDFRKVRRADAMAWRAADRR